MIDHCWLLTQEDANLRSSVVKALEQESRNHIDEKYMDFKLKQFILLSVLKVYCVFILSNLYLL